MGGCPNSGAFLGGTLNIRCRIIIGIQKGPIILTTTHIEIALGLYRDHRVYSAQKNTYLGTPLKVPNVSHGRYAEPAGETFPYEDLCKA